MLLLFSGECVPNDDFACLWRGFLSVCSWSTVREAEGERKGMRMAGIIGCDLTVGTCRCRGADDDCTRSRAAPTEGVEKSGENSFEEEREREEGEEVKEEEEEEV